MEAWGRLGERLASEGASRGWEARSRPVMGERDVGGE